MRIETRIKMITLFLANFQFQEFEGIELDEECRKAITALGLYIAPTATRTWRVRYDDRVEYIICDEYSAEEYFDGCIHAECLLTGKVLQYV